MRILVTGATGQVGGALRNVLGARNSIVPAGREHLDFAQPARLAVALDRLAPDLIVNPAAYTAVDRAEDEPDLAFRVNAEAPGVVARWAAGRGVPLLHFSTDYVFDGAGERPWREDDPPNPLSVYGASKLAGEQAVRGAAGPHLIVRTSWVYAAKGTNFLRTIAKLATERRELRIVADQFGAPTSARMIAGIVAPLIEGAARNVADRFAASQGLLHIAASGEANWYAFAVAIIQGLKARGLPLAADRVVPIATADYPTKAKRPANCRLDLARLRQLFGIATADWRAALAVELDQLATELVPSR